MTNEIALEALIGDEWTLLFTLPDNGQMQFAPPTDGEAPIAFGFLDGVPRVAERSGETENGAMLQVIADLTEGPYERAQIINGNEHKIRWRLIT